jgi:carbamoyl-phosphate synthase large subunit
MKNQPCIAVSGLHRGDNPQPGPAVIRSIRRRHPSARIVGLSYDPLESGLFSRSDDGVDAAFLMPFPDKGPEALLGRLDEICESHPLDMVVPCLDSEIPNYIAVAGDLASRGIASPRLTEKAFVRRDKANLSRLGRTSGVRVPRSVVVHDAAEARGAAEEIGFPVLVKGRQYGAVWATSSVEVASAFHSLAATWGGPVIVQAAVAGKDEYDVVGLGDGRGGLLGFCSIRKIMLTSNGKAFGGIVVSDPDLLRSVERIVAKLKWWGPFELEFVKGSQGHELIEMNPRFPAWTDFPSQIGCNLPAMLVDMMLSREVTPAGNCEPGRMFVRHSVDLVGDVSQLAQMFGGSMVAAGSSLLRSPSQSLPRTMEPVS